jgi:phage gp16-like protein
MDGLHKKWCARLHIARKECGLDEAAYREVLLGSAGVESAAGVRTWKQYYAALAAFRRLGFRQEARTVKEVTTPQKNRDPEYISYRQEYYLRGLWDLASRSKDEASLQRLVKRLTGEERVADIRRGDAQKVILALRAMARKAGYEPDGKARKGEDE